jgi:hypothetical protein
MANHDDFSRRALLGAMMSVSPALAGAARARAPAGAAVPATGNADDGAAMFRQAGTGATPRTIEDKLGERVTPLDFGAAGDANPRTGAGTDDSAALQAAIDHCAANHLPLYLAGRFYKCQWVRLTPRADGLRWYVFGEGGGFVNPATSTSEAPCLYSSALAGAGARARAHPYGLGVSLADAIFVGTGHGVGYMHAIDGHLNHLNCQAERLEDGFLCIGVSGMSAVNARVARCKRGHHFARVADYAFTAGYTAEGAGWNDGILIQGGSASRCERAILHGGSTSEGVLRVRDMVLAAGSQSYVETIGQMMVVEVSGCWFEYTHAGGDDGQPSDMLRFLREPTTRFEPIGVFLVERNHFFLSPPRVGNDPASFGVRYCVDANARTLQVRDNVVQAAPGARYDGFVRNNSGATRTPLASVQLTPAHTAGFTSDGAIAFRNADLADLGGAGSFYYMVDGEREYLLTPEGPFGGDATNFSVHAFSRVYSPQFPIVGDNWLHPGPLRKRINPTGIAVDLSSATTGAEFAGPRVTMSSALNGGISFDGNRTGAETRLERNVFLGFDMTKIYQQANFGRVVMDGNMKG